MASNATARPVTFSTRCGWCDAGILEGSQRRFFCSQQCVVRFLHEKRRRIPNDPALLRSLYWDAGMTTVEMAALFGVSGPRTVGQAMQRMGVPRRPPGQSPERGCLVAECLAPVHKILHAGNGARYGRRCKQHWDEHRRTLAREYVRQGRNHPDPHIRAARAALTKVKRWLLAETRGHLNTEGKLA